MDEPRFLDPRNGDLEDDAAAPKAKSLLAIAGSLLAEISLPRLLVAWGLLIALPALALGGLPIVFGAWLATLSTNLARAAAGYGAAGLVLALLAVGWVAGRRLWPLAERGFWALNAVLVQPLYALCREALRHLSSTALPHAAVSLLAGAIVSGLALLIATLAWPGAHLLGGLPPSLLPRALLATAIANAVVLVAAYCAIAALAWAWADAAMGPPEDLGGFDSVPATAPRWRVVHLSDVHVVGERYGFRIESGRRGPRGNARFAALLARLAALHAQAPLDLILITGDMTDAGRSAEFVEFEAALAAYPALAARTLILPGNHDVNIVDRANPARLDLPTSPAPRLRELRTLAAIDRLQGERVQAGESTLAALLAPHRTALARFADDGAWSLRRPVGALWEAAFPQVLPPTSPEGLGVVLLNSNADTHFSFTNALGLVTLAQVRALDAALAQWPRAVWIVALHHHVVEYPEPAAALSIRIGTVLVNGAWFLRRLRRHAARIVVMHGHRHVDWIGRCAGVRIVSAPSPVMAPEGVATHCYLHSLARDSAGGLALLPPERITLAPTREALRPG